MTYVKKAYRFRQSCIAMSVSLLLAQSAYALQDLSDTALSETTGEGVALLPENFKMVFQGPNDVSINSSYNRSLSGTDALKPEQYDTGFIRIIPIGEDYSKYTGISSIDLGNKRTKADIFIYGLALSQTDNDLNKRFSNTGFKWGTEVNPWLFRAGTATGIRQFQLSNASADISYLALEAPLATVEVSDLDNNIKMGFWLDAFSRTLNSSNKVNPITGAPETTNAATDNDLKKDQRIRLQVVANGLSLNGSLVRLFQTQTSTVAQQNQTLGMASIVRINTNDDPSTLVYANTDANRAILNAKGLRISTATIDDGSAVTPALDRSFAPIFEQNEGLYLYSPNINLVLGNMYQPFIVGSEGRNIILEVTRIPNVPEIYKKIYSFYAGTEATYEADIPTGIGGYYKSVDGRYLNTSDVAIATLYSKSGSTYKVDTKGTYIKNKYGAYIEVVKTGDALTKYKLTNQTALDEKKVQYLGSTCNVSSCGSNLVTAGGSSSTVKYQGNNATHSSISIGTVGRNVENNALNAYMDSNSTGIVFRGVGSATPVNLGSAVIDGVLIQHLKFKTTGL